MKYVVVLGGAISVWSDYEKAIKLFVPDEIVAVNHAGIVYPNTLHHWCSLHPELFLKWKAHRFNKGFPPALNFWTGSNNQGYPECRRGPVYNGSSGRLGMHIAKQIGATHIVLCGLPLEPEGEHFDKSGLWKDAKIYREIWLADAHELRPFTRSMSGWTLKLFGEPTEKWLASSKRPKEEIRSHSS